MSLKQVVGFNCIKTWNYLKGLLSGNRGGRRGGDGTGKVAGSHTEVGAFIQSSLRRSVDVANFVVCRAYTYIYNVRQKPRSRSDAQNERDPMPGAKFSYTRPFRPVWVPPASTNLASLCVFPRLSHLFNSLRPIFARVEGLFFFFMRGCFSLPLTHFAHRNHQVSCDILLGTRMMDP